jgi:DNA mismatch endonuclease (patch repair protein)
MFFPAIRLAVFVHGCYWHRCPACAMGLPRANRAFWKSKFEANLARDAKAASALESLGMDIEIIWEHEIQLDAIARAVALAELIRMRRSDGAGQPGASGSRSRGA